METIVYLQIGVLIININNKTNRGEIEPPWA